MRDKYPAYVSWETFEKIQAMLRDNYAEYDRNKTRGIPRDGEALLHGLVYCGACGHKMVVQYKGGTRYLCNYLRQQHGTPVCQSIPAGPIDAAAVDAFFRALAPAELDAYARAVATRREADEAVLRAQAQQVERLRYRAALAERQYDQVDPDNRLVAAELERRWEETLRDLRQAEAALDTARAGIGEASVPIDDGLRAAFCQSAPPRAMARLGPDDGAQEGIAALPDRQARDPPQRAGHHPHAPGLAGRRRQRARHPRRSARSPRCRGTRSWRRASSNSRAARATRQSPPR